MARVMENPKTIEMSMKTVASNLDKFPTNGNVR